MEIQIVRAWLSTAVVAATIAVFCAPVFAQYEQAKLVAADAVREGYFGAYVDIRGDVVVVGAPGKGQFKVYPGAAYVFRRAGSNWIMEQKLLPSDSMEGDGFGAAVALDGTTIMVASHNYSGDLGAVYVFEWEGTCWVQRQKLLPPDSIDGHFGWSVAIDGDITAIGQYGDEFSGADYSGALCVFRRTGSMWVLEQKLIPQESAPFQADGFGQSVAVKGNLILGGARGMDQGRGAAYVFRWNGITWVEEQKLTSPQSGQYDGSFGQSVAIWGDTVFVGSPDNGAPNYGPGTVSVFRYNGFTWLDTQTLTAPDGGSGDHFGGSVSVHGNQAMVQAVGIPDPTGAFGVAYVFDSGGPLWVLKRKLSPPPDIGRYGGFGAVALDDRYALLGAPGDDDACPSDPYCRSGAAYIYDVQVCLPEIPAASMWGLVALALSILAVAVLLLRRRPALDHEVPSHFRPLLEAQMPEPR